MLHLLSIEHSRQEKPANCLAACAQMALRHIDIAATQDQLNQLLGLTEAGIPASRIKRLAQQGVNVVYATGDDSILRNTIEQGIPLIAFLATGDLPNWYVSLRHAVLVVGFDDADVYLHDPAFPSAPIPVNWDDFLLAWSEFDYAYAVISPKRWVQ